MPGNMPLQGTGDEPTLSLKTVEGRTHIASDLNGTKKVLARMIRKRVAVEHCVAQIGERHPRILGVL